MLYFSDLYVQTVSKGLLDPTERLVGRAAGSHSPWWSFGLPFFATQFLVLATSHRVVLVRHRKGLLTGDRMDSVESFAWRDVEKAKVGGFLFKKKLIIDATGARVRLLIDRGFTAPKDNIVGAQTVVTTWERTKALPAGATERGMLAA